MTFPRLLIICDAPRMKPNFQSAILNACLGGAKWFCAREKGAPARETLEHLFAAARVAEKFGAQVFAHDRADLARAAHADGLHLSQNGLPANAARLCLDFHTPIGVSVHSPESARRAIDEGANYLLFGSIFPTSSHPNALPTGLEKLREVCNAVSIPVFAVGGINAQNAASCLENGAAGVAAISSVWDAPDVTLAVRELRAALGERDAPANHHGEAQNAAPSPLAGLFERN